MGAASKATGGKTPISPTGENMSSGIGDFGGVVSGGYKGVLGSLKPNLGPEGGAPELANIQQGTTVGDVRGSQGKVSGDLAAQQRLLAALQKQGGLNMQSNFANQLMAGQGINAQNAAMSGLQNVAAGTGPNPAQAMLNQATGQNIANQAALMAGQRGAGANVGLMARQAAQQGGALQQNAVGQGATMQANQQLNALQGLGNLGSTQVGQQAGIVNQLAGQQIGQANANTNASLANQQQMQNALSGINQANVANQGGVNTGNVGLAQSQMQAKSGLFGGLMNSAGALGSTFGGSGGGAKGGEVKMMAVGGEMADAAPSTLVAPQVADSGPSSSMGQAVNQNDQQPPMMDAFKKMQDNLSKQNTDTSKRDANDMGELMSIISMFKDGGLAEKGGPVKASSPEEKAEVPGDSYDNDKIDAKLSEHEIVLPREVTLSDDPVGNAARFVEKIISERKLKPKQNFEDGGEAVIESPEVVSPAMPQDAAPQPLPEQGSAEPVPQTTTTNYPAQGTQAPQNQPMANVPVTPADRAAARTAEDMQFADDLRFGKIHPKTYADLFAEKGFLGKAGTIFGLLLSGAGSGLAHQNNAALEMMNNEISRDLEAQKQDQSNKQNWYKLAMDQEKNRAQNELTEAQANGVSIGNEGSALDVDMKKYNNAQAGITDIGASTKAHNSALLGSLASWQGYIDRMPEGPAKMMAQQKFNNEIVPWTMDKISTNNALAEQKTEVIKTLNPKPDIAIDREKYNAAVQRGKFAPNGLNSIKPDDVPKIDSEVQHLTNIRNNALASKTAFNKLTKMEHGGESVAGETTRAGATALSSLAGIFSGNPVTTAITAGAGAAGSRGAGEKIQQYFEKERNAQVDLLSKRSGLSPDEVNAMMPNYFDDKNTIAEKRAKLDSFWKDQEAEATPTLDRYSSLGLKKDFYGPAKKESKKEVAKHQEKPRKKEMPKKEEDKKPEKSVFEKGFDALFKGK